MADTGWVIAGQGRAVNRTSGAATWANPGNIVADDATNATVTVPTASFSHYLVADTLDFSVIPDGATINGIEVRAQLSCNQSFNGRLRNVNIGKDDSTPGTEKTINTTVGTSPAYLDSGTAADLWGLTLSAAEVKASTFQALITVSNSDFAIVRTLSCDAVWMRITYTPPPPLSPPFMSNPFLPFIVR